MANQAHDSNCIRGFGNHSGISRHQDRRDGPARGALYQLPNATPGKPAKNLHHKIRSSGVGKVESPSFAEQLDHYDEAFPMPEEQTNLVLAAMKTMGLPKSKKPADYSSRPNMQDSKRVQ